MASFEASIRIKQRGGVNDTIYTIDKDLNGKLTLEELFNFTKGAIIQVARDTLRQEQLRGFDKRPLTIVDNVRGGNIFNVSPLGKIEFVNTNVDQTKIIIDTYKAIIHRSKIVTGTYFENNAVFFNGNLVAKSLQELEAWVKTKPSFSGTDTVRFVNLVPYARKLERYGITDQRSSTRTRKSTDKKKRSGDRVLAPNGVYFLTARSIQRLYKATTVLFGFISGAEISGFLPEEHKGRKLRTHYKGTKKKPNAGPYFYPSIKLVFQEKR